MADDLAESLGLFRRGDIKFGNPWGLIDFQREVEDFLTLLTQEVDKKDEAEGKRLKMKVRPTPGKGSRVGRK